MKDVRNKTGLVLIFSIISIFSYSQCEDFVVENTYNHPTTYDLCDGDISLHVSGGTEPYSYNWNFDFTPMSGGSDVSSLCDGHYTYTVTDVSNCTINDTVFLYHCTGFDADIVEWNFVSIIGQCDGLISIEGINGLPPYSYSWQDQNGYVQDFIYSTNVSTIENLCVGGYDVTIVDSGECQLSVGFTMSAIITDTCYNIGGFPVGVLIPGYQDNICNGAIKIYMDGNGTAPYTYNWENGNGVIIPGQDSIIEELCGGIYYVTVTDAVGCTASRAFELIPENPCDIISLVACTQEPDSENECNGHINLYAMYNQFDIQSVPQLLESGEYQALCPGVYNIDYTDTHGCLAQTTVSLSADQYESLYSYVVTDIYNSTSINPSPCLGNAQVFAFGGTPPYSFDHSNDRTTQYAVRLCPGLYTVTVSDENQNTYVAEYLIADTSNLYCTQSFPDSIVIAQIANNPIENCSLNTTEINDIRILNYSYNNNVITLNWKITGDTFTEVISQSYYIILGSGIYNFELGLYCLSKSEAIYLTAKDQIYIDANNQNVEIIKNRLNVTAHPNPFSDNFLISLETVSDYTVKLISINGKVILNKLYRYSDEINIDVNDLDSGFYIVSVSSDSGTVNLKMVKR